jgi:membrane fusion protein (multidrug efflux system)
MRSTRRLRLLVVLGLVAVVLALAGIKAAQIGAMIKAGKAMVPPPESVASAVARQVQWTPSRGSVATLVAVRGVVLGSELAGTVRDIAFESGGAARKGDVLVRLDTSTEEAQLAAAQADATLARASLERAQALHRGAANSPAELEAAEARAKQAAATVASLQATIAKKTIRAPFDGRLAIRQVELGQVVAPGTPITSLQSVTPIYADFSFPQQALADLTAGQRVQLATDAYPGHSWEGRITTINPEVDVATRSVRIRATFDNPDARLRPGMYATVDVLASEEQIALVVPATAVLHAPYGDSLFVLKEQQDGAGKAAVIAHQRFVRLGERRGDFVVVASGLEPGERVVSAGAFKVKNGSPVAIHDDLAPRAELAPHPAEP